MSGSFGKYMSRNDRDFGAPYFHHKDRKIDGKEFITTWYAMNRISADRRAYNLRRSGWYARVLLAFITEHGYERYEVWYRSKGVNK